MSFLEISNDRIVLANGKLDSNYNYLFPVSTVLPNEPYLFIPNINQETILVIVNSQDRYYYNSPGLNIVYSTNGYKRYSRTDVLYEADGEEYVMEAR